LIPSDQSTRIEQANLETCGEAADTVVVIDVLRAFTTAAYAFAAGASEIMLVSTVAEALALRERFPGALVMGEVHGLPVEGFDFSNSPAEIAGHDLGGRRLIQRTSAGTQGVVRSLRAETLLATSFVCASATVSYIKRHAPTCVTFVITGIHTDRDGDEDAACADYMAALLRGERPDTEPFLQRVRDSLPGRWFADPAQPDYPAEDLDLCTAVDRFEFAMRVERRDGLLVMQTVE
jgi:2-phosphosulfolactate phosphatase